MCRNPELIKALRETLKHIEQEWSPDDPTLMELKRWIVRALADMETSHTRTGKAA